MDSNPPLMDGDLLGMPVGSKPCSFVFHGGSGSALADIREAISYGVIKMNIDTDTQVDR